MSKKKLYLNHELIAKKIADMEKAITLLDKIALVAKEDFLEDQILISGARYQLILAIEAAQSICNHLAARVAREAPESYADCFRILGNSRITSKELTSKLVSMAKFRNLLVHQYGKIDDSVVYDILKNDVKDIMKYVAEISTFLKSVLEEEQKNEEGKALPGGRGEKES